MEWRKIYAANRDVITDPDKIFAGQALEIPVGGGTTAGCKFGISYSNPRALPELPPPDHIPGNCEGAIHYNITAVRAGGDGVHRALRD